MAQRDENYMLTGIVELDDTYFGKAKKGGKRGRGTAKTKVFVALSKDEDGNPQFAKMQFAKSSVMLIVVIETLWLRNIARVSGFGCGCRNAALDAYYHRKR